MPRILILAILPLALSCSEKSETSDDESPKAKPAKQTPTATAKPAANKAPTRPDWSKLFAAGPCVLTAEAVSSAVGVDGLAAKPNTETGSCSYSKGNAIFLVNAPPLTVAGTDKQLAGTQGQVASKFYNPVDLGDKAPPATWRGNVYSMVQVFTHERIVTIKAMHPQLMQVKDKAKREAILDERKQHAIAIAKLLLAKAK